MDLERGFDGSQNEDTLFVKSERFPQLDIEKDGIEITSKKRTVRRSRIFFMVSWALESYIWLAFSNVIKMSLVEIKNIFENDDD